MNNINTKINPVAEIEIWKLQLSQATHLLKSGAIPGSFTNAEQALAVIQYGRELDLPPMTALQNISLIKGRPALSANLIGARLKKAGYNFKPTKYTDTEVSIKFVYPDGDTFEISYTMDEAKKAGNASKDNYSKYDKEMLYARCLTRGGRIVAPEVLAGVYSSEEFDIITPEQKKTPVKIEANISETTEKKQIEAFVSVEKEEELENKAKVITLNSSTNSPKLTKAINDMKTKNSLGTLQAHWNINKEFWGSKKFVEAKDKRKAELLAETAQKQEDILDAESVNLTDKDLEAIDQLKLGGEK